MASGMTGGSTDGYLSLFDISEAFLKPFVTKTTRRFPSLSSGEFDEDIYHDILLCLIKTSVDRFLYKDGTFNNDPEGYLKWSYTLAKNIIYNYARKQRVRTVREQPLPENESDSYMLAERDPELASIGVSDTLEECFKAAVYSDSAIYIIIIWLLRAVLLAEAVNLPGLTHIDDPGKAADYIVSFFSEKTLGEIYAVLVVSSKSLPWMDFEGAEGERMDGLLSAPFDGVPIGERKLCEFYMKKGDKATISDWVNRMNVRIRRSLGDAYSV